MDAIGKFFLRAKAPQIFLLVAGVYAVGFSAFFKSITALSYESVGLTIQRLPLEIVSAICSSIVFFWLWVLGVSLNEIVKPQFRRSVIFFSLALAVSAAYLMLFSISVQNPRILNAIAPLALVTSVCMFYALRFVARGLVVAEISKDPTVQEYIVPFLLLLFFPLGIWVLQPRINQLSAKKGEGD